MASAFRRKIWIVAPLAAAAILIFALVLPSKTQRPDSTPATTVATTHSATPPQTSTPQPPAAQAPSHTVIAQAGTRPARTQQSRRAVVAANDVTEDVVWIDPLAAPPSIAVAAIVPAGPAPVPSIDPAPREIPALEVRPISDTPRERRNQE